MMVTMTALAIGMLSGCGKDTDTTVTTAAPTKTAAAPTEAEAAPTEAETTATDTVSDVVEDVVADIVYPGIIPEVKEILHNERMSTYYEKNGEFAGAITKQNVSLSTDIFGKVGNEIYDEETGYVLMTFGDLGQFGYFSDGETEIFGYCLMGQNEINGTIYESSLEKKDGYNGYYIIDPDTMKIVAEFYESDDRKTYLDKYGIEHDRINGEVYVGMCDYPALAERCGYELVKEAE